MHKNDFILASYSHSLNQTLTPPVIIARAGQDVVKAYAELHAHFSQAQNDQYGVGAADFLDWLECQWPGISLEHVVQANISDHLKNLGEIGCSDSEQSSRLCGINHFLMSMIPAVPALARIPKSGYGRPCPPLLIVENSTETSDYVAVYTDFLMSHTNVKTRDVYAQGLRRFFNWLTDNTSGTHLQDIKEIRGSQVAAFIASVSETDSETGLTDDKARTVGTILSAVRTYLDACIAAGILKTNVARAVRLPRVPSGRRRDFSRKCQKSLIGGISRHLLSFGHLKAK